MNGIHADKPAVAPKVAHGRILLALLILVLPAFFFHWALPFISHTTVGNDYQFFAIPQQMEVQFSIANGSYPLYVPGFAGGQSVQALTLGQPYHPISAIAHHLPGYWSGHGGECNTLLRLLSLGLAHLSLFAFLRRLGLGRGYAFMLSMVTTYNLRMLDLFRYGAALESWTGHLLLCAFIGLYFLMRSSLWVRIGVVVSTYWLVTSGHPQMAYYGVLGAGLFALLLPFIARAMGSDRRDSFPRVARFWASTAGLFALGLLLSAAFVVPFATDFFLGNPRSSAGRDFTWALGFQDSLWGTLNNLFLPLRADVHGAFAGSSLVLLAALVPALLVLRMRIPAAVWAAWGLAIVVFLAIQGDRTPVYWGIWRYLPLASSIRTAGRWSLLLPVLLMAVLAWLFGYVEGSARNPETGASRKAIFVLGLAALVASLSYLAAFSRMAIPASQYSPVSIREVSTTTETTIVALGLLTVILFALLARLPRWRGGLIAAMCVCTCAETKLVLDHGTWKDPVAKTPTFSEMASQKRENLDYRFASGEGMFTAPLWRQASNFHVEPSLGKVYFKWRSARDVDDAYRIIEGGVAPDEVIVERAESTEPSPPSGVGGETARVKLLYSSFNRLVFDVESSGQGYFTLSYPYSGHWMVLVDGTSLTPHRANGGNHAIAVPPGHSTVEWRYRSPGQIAGWGIGCVTLILAVFVLVFPAYGGKRATLCVLLAVLVAGGLFTALVRNLYAGQNLGTAYEWTGPAPAGARPNLAYGRRTTMSSTYQVRHNCCPFVSSKGTDGNQTRLSGFMTEEEESPVWGVDLGQPRDIGSVIAYESRKGAGWNLRPIFVATSLDGHTWLRLDGEFSESAGALEMDFPSPVTARYLAIRAGGRCRLSFDEVEVFPPDR